MWSVDDPLVREYTGFQFHHGHGGTHAEASFPAIGPIMVPQRADDLVVGVRSGEGAREGGFRWHGLARIGRGWWIASRGALLGSAAKRS